MEFSRKEFWNTIVDKDIKDSVKVGAKTGYIGFIVNVVFLFFNSATDNILAVIEAILVLVLAVGVHKLRSRVCAVVLVGMYFIGQVFIFIADIPAFLDGQLSYFAISRFFIFVAFLFGYSSGVAGTFHFQRDWKRYCAGVYTPKEKPDSATKSLKAMAQMQAREDMDS